MGSSVVSPEDVLESLMNDGTIDAIRLKIINQLKANEELKSNTITMVEQSKVLNTPGAEKQTKRDLFDALRRELETPVLEKASKAVWELILDSNGLGKEIGDTVEKIFCQLGGRELPPPLPIAPPPPPPPSTSTIADAQPENEKENNEKEEGKKVVEVEMAETSSRKRTFGDMSTQGEVDVNGGADHPPSNLEDGITTPSTNSKA